jgi:hypothetical protein
MANGARSATRSIGDTWARWPDQAITIAAAATPGQNSTPLRMTSMSETCPMARGSSIASVLRRPTTNPTSPGRSMMSRALTGEL